MSCIILNSGNEALALCASQLQEGGLVAFPTETVYGLGANALDGQAVAAIYAAKGRPSFNPLIVHVSSVENAQCYGQFTPLAQKLAAAFCPGPLTLVLERTADCPLTLLVSAGLNSIALRIPSHPVARTLLEKSNLPIAAPSANRSGRISPTQATHVAEEFAHQKGGHKDKPILVLDGGACAIGLESTVIDARGEIPILLRHGSITAEDIAHLTGQNSLTPEQVIQEQADVFHSPGMLKSHYAPKRPVRLNALNTLPGEALLAFGNHTSAHKSDLNLSQTGNLVEAAANLFAHLRTLDRPPFTGIAVMPIPETGLGIAINDRLRRAATR